MKKVAFTLTAFMVVLSACKKNIQIDMVLVEGGFFTMGSLLPESDDDEGPLHDVTLNDFYIGRYEVTQEQWFSVMGKAPSNFRHKKNPVECVSWYDVEKFISKLNKKTRENFRLPTEAEWEYAALGGKNTRRHLYSGGGSIYEVAWFAENSNEQPYPVGTKAPNELGIYDMTGNVHEWCADWYDGSYYSHSPESDPPGPPYGESRVFRGGSWASSEKYCRIANRNHISPEAVNFTLGFRLAKDAQ